MSGALIGLGLGLVRPNTDQTAAAGVLILGLGGYVLAPPVIHAAHDRWGIAAASLSIRALMPSVGAALGGSVGPASSEPCPHQALSDSCGPASGSGATVGALIGMVLASALDAGLFSYENPQAKLEASSTFGLAPALSGDGKRGELRAFGTF